MHPQTPRSELPQAAASLSSSLEIDKLLAELRARFDWLDARWIPLERPLYFDAYAAWIEAGNHGEMDYLRRHLPLKENPQGLLAEARSLLVISKSYVPTLRPHDRLSGLRLARYAENTDYHEWFGDELKEAARFLEERVPGLICRSGVDSLPVMERDYGARAGLGYIGKNSCLIDRAAGSFFFLGEILTSARVETSFAAPTDFCGKCTRCMDACPTGALTAPRLLDARRCISYWTIEAKSVPPVELAAQFGDHFFGCDICQSVCPWNQKAFKGREVLVPEPLRVLTTDMRAAALRDLSWLLSASEAELRAELRDSPLGRAKAFGLRRNAIIVAANSGFTEVRDLIATYAGDEKLGELARWAQGRLGRE